MCIRDRFYKIHTKETIEQSSCAIVNVNGLAFKNFLSIIKNGFHTKCLVLTDRDTGTASEHRGEALKEAYKTVSEIEVEITSLSTFEKDLIATNNTDDGKNILCSVIKIVRPTAGKAFVEELGENPIETESFFALIKNHKSEFALQLALHLNNDSSGFAIPEYIIRGINIIHPPIADVDASS